MVINTKIMKYTLILTKNVKFHNLVVNHLKVLYNGKNIHIDIEINTFLVEDIHFFNYKIHFYTL